MLENFQPVSPFLFVRLQKHLTDRKFIDRKGDTCMSRKRIFNETMSAERKFSRIELALELLIEENKHLRRKVNQQEKAISSLLSSGQVDKEYEVPFMQVH